MTQDTRLNVAIAKQKASGLMAMAYDKFDRVECAELSAIIALLGEALKEQDQPVPSVTQVLMWTGTPPERGQGQEASHV